MNYRTLIGLLYIALITQMSYAQTYEETKTYTRSFKTNATTLVDISNKYGMVIISTWDKDSVQVKATMKISERNESRFNKIKDNINIEFSFIQNQINAHTVFGNKYSGLIKDVAEATNYLSSNNEGSRINYRIYVPEYINLTIDNKYGDVILPVLKGNVKVTLSNGNIQARDIDGQSDFNLAFGNAKIDKLRQANISLNFVQTDIESAGSLTINGRSSEINIGTVETLRLDTRRDRIYIKKVNSLFGESYFSKLNLGTVINECKMQLSYGDLSMINMSRNFTNLELKSQACDLNIQLSEPKPYKAKIQAKNTYLNLPSDLKSTVSDYKAKIETQPVEFIYSQPTNLKLKINITGADLKISHQ